MVGQRELRKEVVGTVPLLICATSASRQQEELKELEYYQHIHSSTYGDGNSSTTPAGEYLQVRE